MAARFTQRKVKGKMVATTSYQPEAEPEENPVEKPHSSIAFTKESHERIQRMGKKTFIYELEFRPVNTMELPGFKERFEAEIERRGWQRLTARAAPVNHTLVREFYGNVPDAHKPCEVFLRGKWVSFTEEAIAEFYHLPRCRGDFTYSFRKKTAAQVEAVTQTIALPNATWNMGANGDSVTWIPRGALNDEARLWLRFIDNRLHSNRVSGEVTWYRATILYGILAKKEVNAAAIIHNFIKGNKKNFGMPSLISEMARQARVPVKNTDNTVQPELEPETFFHAMKKSKRRRLDGASGSGHASEDEEDAIDENPPAAAFSDMDDIRQRLGRMEMNQQYMGMKVDALLDHFQVPVPSYAEYWTPSFPPPPED